MAIIGLVLNIFARHLTARGGTTAELRWPTSCTQIFSSPLVLAIESVPSSSGNYRRRKGFSVSIDTSGFEIFCLL